MKQSSPFLEKNLGYYSALQPCKGEFEFLEFYSKEPLVHEIIHGSLL